MKQAAVEKWKLTKEQLGFQKKFRQLKEIGSLLELGTLQKQQELKDLQGLWEELNMETQKLGQQAPKHPTFELFGQD